MKIKYFYTIIACLALVGLLLYYLANPKSSLVFIVICICVILIILGLIVKIK
ncbi:MAG: hypothetical protein A4E26_01278 [Methanobacterium sp. PtaU1.Bin097]|nr:MAG: hypothetical protein A4E26_01278 [Methanobacterium sp. PtaU1.Bin097]